MVSVNPVRIHCQQCFIGRLIPCQIPYFQALKEGALIAPKVPALICDSCRYVEYDPAAIEWIQRLLQAPASDRRLSAKRPSRPRVPEPALPLKVKESK